MAADEVVDVASDSFEQTDSLKNSSYTCYRVVAVIVAARAEPWEAYSDSKTVVYSPAAVA